jgi:phospholipid-binding lipoprotein MlaA
VSAQTAKPSPDDPFESLNRKSFALSIKLDQMIVAPLARVSVGLTPAPVEKAIHNIIVNLSEPVVILNDLLQGRPQGVIKATTRFLVNSTFGLAGALDLAAGAGLRHEPNGFGDTLGRYGVKSGPYLFVPLIGPSDFRDLLGAGVDEVSTPLFYVRFPYRTQSDIALTAMGGLDERAQAEPQFKALLDGAADPYATLRSTYLQSRQAEIRGDVGLPPLPDIDESGGADASGAATPSSAIAPATPNPPDEGAPLSGAAVSSAAPPPPTPDAVPSGPSPSPPPSPATPSEPEPRSPGPGPA